MELQSRIIMDLATLNKESAMQRAVAERNALNISEENASLKQQLEYAQTQLSSARSQLDSLALKYEASSRAVASLERIDSERSALVANTQQYAHEIIDFAKEGNHPTVVISVVQSLMRSLNGVSVEEDKRQYAGQETVEGESSADSNVELDATALVAAAAPSVKESSTARNVKRGHVKDSTREG